MKLEKTKQKMIERMKKKKLRAEKGDDAVPRGVSQTIEKMRKKDETFIEKEDSEVEGDEAVDEFADYFKDTKPPKLMMTTNRRPSGKLFDFLKDLKNTIPNSFYYERKNFRIKDIVEWAGKKDFTNLLVFVEKNGIPHTLIMTHLPKGPTAYFRVSSVKLSKDISNRSRMTEHLPEMILNHFDTRLGH